MIPHTPEQPTAGLRGHPWTYTSRCAWVWALRRCCSRSPGFWGERKTRLKSWNPAGGLLSFVDRVRVSSECRRSSLHSLSALATHPPWMTSTQTQTNTDTHPHVNRARTVVSRIQLPHQQLHPPAVQVPRHHDVAPPLGLVVPRPLVRVVEAQRFHEAAGLDRQQSEGDHQHQEQQRLAGGRGGGVVAVACCVFRFLFGVVWIVLDRTNEGVV